MLRLPLVPPCPRSSASSGRGSAICPRGEFLPWPRCPPASLGSTAQPSPVCSQAGNSPKVALQGRELPGSCQTAQSWSACWGEGGREGGCEGATSHGVLSLTRHSPASCSCTWVVSAEQLGMDEVPEQPRVGILRVSHQGQPEASLSSPHCSVPPQEGAVCSVCAKQRQLGS